MVGREIYTYQASMHKSIGTSTCPQVQTLIRLPTIHAMLVQSEPALAAERAPRHVGDEFVVALGLAVIPSAQFAITSTIAVADRARSHSQRRTSGQSYDALDVPSRSAGSSVSSGDQLAAGASTINIKCRVETADFQLLQLLERSQHDPHDVYTKIPLKCAVVNWPSSASQQSTGGTIASRTPRPLGELEIAGVDVRLVFDVAGGEATSRNEPLATATTAIVTPAEPATLVTPARRRDEATQPPSGSPRESSPPALPQHEVNIDIHSLNTTAILGRHFNTFPLNLSDFR